MIKNFLNKYFELVFWITAIVCLALTNPGSTAHFSLCPLKLMGITWCPGCGLGHAIAYFFRGDLTNSIRAHWLGIPAVCAIFYRIFTLAIPVKYAARMQER